MSTVRRRRIAATALATTALLALGGCGTGFSAQTSQVYQAGVGANHRGDIDVLNTLFVANDDGSATLSAAIVNNTDADDELSSVTVTTLDDKQLPVSGSETLKLPAGDLASASGYWISKGATAGDYVKVTLTFSDTAPVTIEAPVVTRTAEYDKVAGAPKTEPTPTETESTEDSSE